jgi:hypothetical protein
VGQDSPTSGWVTPSGPFCLYAAGSGNLRGRARAHGQVAQLVRASD